MIKLNWLNYVSDETIDRMIEYEKIKQMEEAGALPNGEDNILNPQES